MRVPRVLRHPLARLTLAGAALVALFACNAPFIPIPPPPDPTFAPITVPDGTGGTKRIWETKGGAFDAAAFWGRIKRTSRSR